MCCPSSPRSHSCSAFRSRDRASSHASPPSPIALFGCRILTHTPTERSPMRRLAAFAVVTLCLSLLTLAADDAGKTFKPDDEGYIRNWLLLEPIKLTEDVSSHTEEQEKPVFDKDFAKKNHAPKDGDKLKANDAEFAWAAKESSDAIVDLTGMFEGKDTQQCLFIGVAYVVAPQDM